MTVPSPRHDDGPAGWSAATIEVLDRLSRDGEFPSVQIGGSLAPFCTYRVGGPAAAIVTVASIDDLVRVHDVIVGTGVGTLIVGKGSNLVVADRGFDGLAIVLGEPFSSITIADHGDDDDARRAMADEPAGAAEDTPRAMERVEPVIVTLGGATLLPVAARTAVRHGLDGFTWAVGIPGSAGGAVAMNAGGHGADMAAVVHRAHVFSLSTGQLEWWSAARLNFGYRHSAIGSGDVVIAVELGLRRGDRSEGEARLGEIVRWRREHQPGGPNAGSVFANPPDDSAGRLIEAAGLKGYRHATASVSTKHANFIQADPDGSADDIAALITIVQQRVFDTFGVTLRPENRLVGFDSPSEGGSTPW